MYKPMEENINELYPLSPSYSYKRERESSGFPAVLTKVRRGSICVHSVILFLVVSFDKEENNNTYRKKN